MFLLLLHRRFSSAALSVIIGLELPNRSTSLSVTARGVLETVYVRNVSLTLEDREYEFVLVERGVGLQTNTRTVAMSLHSRRTALTLKEV